MKPFELDELVARVQALLRRAAGRGSDVIEHGSIRVNASTGDVAVDGARVTLSRRELAVLLALLDAHGRILTAAQLEERLYGFEARVESNAVSVHIHHLRRKLGPDVIETVRGMGYRTRRAAR